VRLDHRHGEYLVEVVESEDDNTLITKAIYIKAHIVKAKSNGLDDIVGMLVHVLQELLNIRVAA